MLKITTVCGFGVGSSLVLKMQIDDVLRDLGVDADVYPCDITSATAEDSDIIFTSNEFAEQLKALTDIPVFQVDDFLDLDNLKKIVKNALEDIKK